jgi:hypothetical protein
MLLVSEKLIEVNWLGKAQFRLLEFLSVLQANRKITARIINEYGLLFRLNIMS